MERVAKLFKNGRNQAVRLPVEFEFDTDRVYIRKDKEGNVILSKNPAKPEGWGNVFALVKKAKVPDNFLDEQERNQSIADRDPFAGMD
ncbi:MULTISPECIES: antitoxin [Buttiauxella]|jgi:antitoxin VapB|uniref:VapB family antitoxin n=1 Tax=Buttiauxella ferragutiae ATCC 51602 TaxID=1354252 RepID=A0ABX2W2B3_9ENTR|nr:MULTISPECIES: AbrB/MazE/SpoVT family DNA-binding domain-containing protein [Buttiauxella]AYN27226.1 AbrB/MazE/SpoVT family DNA-binding domain-containing protein [Buttiauxella sp. 3AFRM03]MCE0825077.1 AbrB/MazE/SpoVT family DNA-binding domain-containing protein [Buttiauxella ferragutiae]OAT24629.1 VapB family antitoxin [Buttiauxella ferragutiae ATCC 51602]TDN51820.1 antitoxin VapB [Buttiauxella sp. JUb87]UNK60325.1 AbrB/MazE/SpoVT family DNA-binding domain-containing protein [Buttiauxella fe